MTKGKFLKKASSIIISTTMVVTLVTPNVSEKVFKEDVKAATVTNLGNIGTGKCGIDQAAHLPTFDTNGNYRFTSSNYDSNHAALDTTDWATNWLWDQEGISSRKSNELSGTAYALPLAYLMKKDGLRVCKPSMTSSKNNVSAYMNYLDNDAFCDWKFNPNWTLDNASIDKSTAWSYDAVTTNPNNSSQSMKITMTQGSPFTYISFNNSNQFTLTKLRSTFSSEIIYEGVYNGCKMLVFRTLDTTNQVHYPNIQHQYYALYLPQSANVEFMGTDNELHNKIGTRKITLPSDKTYASFAWLSESANTQNNDNAINIAKQYRP